MRLEGFVAIRHIFLPYLALTICSHHTFGSVNVASDTISESNNFIDAGSSFNSTGSFYTSADSRTETDVNTGVNHDFGSSSYCAGISNNPDHGTNIFNGTTTVECTNTVNRRIYGARDVNYGSIIGTYCRRLDFCAAEALPTRL